MHSFLYRDLSFGLMMPILADLVTSKSVGNQSFLEKQCSIRKYCKIYYSHLNLQNESLEATNQARSDMRQSSIGSVYQGASEPHVTCQSPGKFFDIELGLDDSACKAPQLPANTFEGLYSWCSPLQMEYLCDDRSGLDCFESNL